MTLITSDFGARSTALDVVAGLDMHGQRAVVTGGAAGIGLETTRALAVAGAHVTMAVRDAQQGAAAVAALTAAHPGIVVDSRPLDLADLSSVRGFATAWGAAPLHVLVTNAGIMACPLTRTAAGWELQLAVNHLGHAALVRALLPALLAAAPARVVALSSAAHRIASVDLEDPFFERRPYSKWKAYGQAKTCNGLMALALDGAYASHGLTANAVHPGAIMTGLQQHLSLDEQRASGLIDEHGNPPAFFKSAAQGAATSTWAATAPALAGRGGLYLEDCKQGAPATPEDRWAGYAPYLADRDLAARLWAWTCSTLDDAGARTLD